MLDYYRYNLGQFSISFHEIGLTGSDTFSFLHAQSTYDVSRIEQNSFQLISFLDPQGKVEFYAWVIKKNSESSLLVPLELINIAMERLNRFLISEDVTFSPPEFKTYTFLIGPDASSWARDAIVGTLFDETAYLVSVPLENVKTLSEEEVNTWRGLTGWPSFDGHDHRSEILNNLRLFDLSYSPNKGCYPGQETVSKIATRRGASYSPVLIEMDSIGMSGEMIIDEKKIGTAFKSYEWKGKNYLWATLLRDFRVDGLRIQFKIQTRDFFGSVKYFPLIKGDSYSKSRELFYEATEFFKKENLKKAEENFLLSIKLDPLFADAYESLGVMLGRQGRYQEAIDLMKKLNELDPKSVLAHTNMSLYLMKLGKINEAEEQKSLATIKSFQSYGDEAKRKQQDLEKKQKLEKEWDQREQMFLQVLEIDPDDTLANYGLGSIYVEKGEWQRAKDYLEKVIKEDSKYSVAYLALGRALKGLGLTESARDAWNEGIKVSAAKGDLMPANQMQQELNKLRP